MAAVSIEDEVLLVDAFLADRKMLDGAPPEFGERQRGLKARRMWEAAWPIAGSDGIVAGGMLRISVSPASDKPLTLSVILRSRCIYRVDFVDSTVCHRNPLWARAVGLPARVCGPHVHTWEDNRGDVLAGAKDLPCRVPLPANIRNLNSSLPWMAERINLTLTPRDRSFRVPGSLF